MFFLGIDGGQTKTLGIIANEKGEILSLGKGRALDHILSPQGPFIAKLSFHEVISSAIKFLNLSSIKFESAFLGLTGVPNSDSYEAKEYMKIAKEVINSKLIGIDSDSNIALAGAFLGKKGIIVISGTGSIALGFDGERYARCGGFGYLFGDEGGGFYIALEGIKIALKYEDGCFPYTLLKEKILKESSFSSIEELVRSYYANKIDRHKISLFTKSVLESAEAGDKFAQKILINAGKKLAELLECVYRKLNFKGKVPVTVSGGVFNISLVKKSFKENLDKNIYDLGDPEFPGVIGALIRAYQLAGISISSDLIKNLKVTAKTFDFL